MKRLAILVSGALMLLASNRTAAQSYDFSAITQILDDSASMYLERIYVDVYQDDSLIYHYQHGWLQCNNVRLGLASSTKWVSAAIFLRLAEKGWLTLDDSIGMYLPVFSQYGKGHTTLRDAYSMSSGVFSPGHGVEYHRDPALTLQQSADSIAKNLSILYPTGDMIGYDGSMMHVWGRVAEVIDSTNGNNRDWRTIAKEEFFDLMDMDSTDYTDFYPNNPAVAGGIETTPCDYLKFLKMLSNQGIYNGDTILQQSSIDEMFFDQTNSAPIYHTYWPHNHPDFPATVDTMRYTFGAWWTELDNSGNIIQITSPGAYGHYPFYDRCRNIYGTFFCFIPVTQGGGMQMIPTYLKFLRILREEFGPCDMVSSVEETRVKANLVTLFPNPASEILSIRTEKEVRTIKLINLLGQPVKEISVNSREYELKTHGMGTGIFVLQILFSDNEVVSRKIIIQ